MEPPAGAAPASSVYETVALLIELWRRVVSAAGFAPAIFCMKGRRVDWATPRGCDWCSGQDTRTCDLHVRKVAFYLTELPKQIGAGERLRSVISALATPRSTIEPHLRTKRGTTEKYG
jgi:hypothetical protein